MLILRDENLTLILREMNFILEFIIIFIMA